MTPDQKTALKQALDQHSFRMSIKDAAPEDIEQLPEDFQVPSYSANASPIYDNQLFPKITSADDLIKLGYATPEGVATESGEMAISLKKAGALNDDYTLNDTGKAMMANPADLLEEENLALYNKAKELDLDGSGKELSWGDTFSQFGKEVKEGAKNLALLLATATPTSSITGGSPYAPVARTAKEQAALNLEAEGALGGLVKSGAQLATGVSKIAGTGLIKALADSEEEEREALSSFDQRFEKIDRDIQASRASEVIDAMGQMAGAELGLTEAREKNVELVGKEEAAAIEKRGESAGQFAGMINPYGAAAMTGKVAFGVAGKGLGVAFRPISRSFLQADSKAALVLERTRQLASLERRTAGFQAAAQAAERQAVIAESMAEKFSKAGLTDRANNALKLANQSRVKGQEALTRVGGFTDEITKVSDDLAKATQSAGVADKVLQMGQVAKQIPYLPVVAIGKTLELTGRGMIGIDKGLSTFAAKVGADKAYNAMNRISSLSGLGGAGAALGLGPVAFIPAAARLAWSTAPYLKAAGEYVSLVGKEASKARGQIGFWKRIYEMPNKGPAHRMVSGLMDTATAGGLVTGMGSRITKGLLASYPVDLAYEWVSEGGDLNPNVFKQAAVETLFFGGTGAALGGITMGSANRIKQLQNGDALNFYSSISDPAQRLMYNGMPSDLKRVVGTFSASNPGAKIQFVNQGLGAYDRNTKTVMINPNAPNPLKPLLTHEFMHHMLNNGIGDGVIAQLVGDGFQTGGLLRGKDGSYDAQYSDFKEEYVGRLRKQHEREVKLRDAIGDPMTKSERDFKTPDEKYLAEEYFIETNVDDMLGLVESGKLGKMAGRMIINDKVRALGDSILNKSSILRDLHFRIGGVIDNSGKMVTGNGFLGGKLYQSPEVRRMFQKMVSESVGRRGGIDAAKRKAREGVEIPIQGKSDPILGELGSLWESDSDGSPLVDGNGDFVPLKKETDELRSQAGLLLVDDLKARQNRGETIPDGELAYNPENNTWSGQYLNDRQIELLSLSGRFNSKQIKQLRLLNEGARQTSDTNADPATRGHRFSVIYQSALKKNRKGQWKYDQIKPQLRDIVPYGVEISKDGNILIRIMSTNQLFANVSEKAASKRGRMLYDGNMETILRDANAIIDLHGKNQATDAYFKEKYGGKWETHKSFINSVFGNVGKGHKDINPLVASDRVDAVVKSYRLDRMNKATQLVGSTQLPYQNNMIKINYLPEGEPIMDANGEPKDLRNTPRYEATSQVKMPEQERQMPEKRVAFEQDQDKKAQTNGNQPTTIQAESSRTGTGGPETTGEGLRGQGGLPRGPEQLQSQGRPGDQSVPLIGLPATVTVPGIGKYTFGPNETARNVAAEYASSVGIDYNPPKTYAKVDKDRAAKIADAYDKMAHAPSDPRVKESYDAMIKETLDQWEAIKKTGLVVEPIPAGAKDPYAASPRLAVIDVKDNNHLWFFPTESGFGGTESSKIDISGNPLMRPTGEVLNGHVMLANDVFRIVHDYFGHIKEGVGFRADGEENAWRSHSAMYSDKARPAMTAETRGQNSWVNFGPFAEFNKTATGADTQYAPQKTGLLPDWVMQEGASDPESNNVRFMPEANITTQNDRVQKGYDYAYLDSLSRDSKTGIVQLTRPIRPDEALPLISERIRITDKDDAESFDFSRASNVKLYTNNGNDVRFRYDPSLIEAPPIKDFAIEHAGKRFQIAMADRHTATGGDMGGVLFPWLKSNQETIIGDDGKEYKAVWANNRWLPVLSMRKKAFTQGIFDLGVYIMGEDAHGSNIRTVRTVSNEIANAGISEPSKKLLLAAANHGVKTENISHYKAELKKKNSLLGELDLAISKTSEDIDPKGIAKLKKEKALVKKQISLAEQKLSLYALTTPEVKFGALMKNYKSTMTGFRNGTKSQKVVDARLKELKEFLKTKDFKSIAKEIEGKQMISLASSFVERKAAVNNTYGIEIDGFNTENVAEELSDFNGATINQIIASVELSRNPELFALYLGSDPSQAKFMTPQETSAAEKLKANPNFVPHEAYEWVMLGPKDGNNFLNSNPKRLVEYVPDYARQYYEKTGKLGPGAAETSVMGAARDSQEVILELPKIKLKKQ